MTCASASAGLEGARLELVRELLAPPYPGGVDAFVAVLAHLREAFPDIHYTIDDDVVAENDRVVVRWHWTGTHRAPFRGHAATGKRVTNGGMAIFTVKDGRIARGDLETDRLGFLQAIGVVPEDVVPRR